MLEVAAYPDFTIAAMSFNFWGKLARQLQAPRGAPGGAAAAATSSGASTRFSAPNADGARWGESAGRE